MTVNFGPYIQSVSSFTRTNNVEPVGAATPVPAARGEEARYDMDIDLVRFVDPVLEGEAGYLFDIYV